MQPTATGLRRTVSEYLEILRQNIYIDINYATFFLGCWIMLCSLLLKNNIFRCPTITNRNSCRVATLAAVTPKHSLPTIRDESPNEQCTEYSIFHSWGTCAATHVCQRRITRLVSRTTGCKTCVVECTGFDEWWCFCGHGIGSVVCSFARHWRLEICKGTSREYYPTLPIRRGSATRLLSITVFIAQQRHTTNRNSQTGCYYIYIYIHTT